MPKEWRYISFFKELKIVEDKISKDIYSLYKKHFQSQFDYARENLIGYNGGDNAWTQSLFKLDFDEIFPSPTQSYTLTDYETRWLNHTFRLLSSSSNIQNVDNKVNWIIQNNRNTFLELLRYRIDKKQSNDTISNDIKNITTIFKKTLGDTSELYKKYSQYGLFRQLLVSS